MSLRHTKSTSGRTHRLTLVTLGRASRESLTLSVTKFYTTTPEFDDQVQGDLIRAFEHTHPGKLGVIGTVPGGVTVDATLDLEEAKHAGRAGVVNVDARRRVDLSRFVKPKQWYRATAHADGSIVLEPVTPYTREEFEKDFPGVPFPEWVTA